MPTTTSPLATLLTLSLLATTALALPATSITKRSNSATTHGAAAPGVTYCDVSFGDAYYIHVGEPWAGGAGCDNIYHALVGDNDDENWATVSGWSCQPDGAPDANGWQPTYLGFNAAAGNLGTLSSELTRAFGNPDGSAPVTFHCSY
ncbi:hypothetical protein M409DRAFT_17956 [Zasmidium cellare ATCC 36951]|uniref:Uncharacterized protein n=1 Tax=Zasmidium cellare ATCC 36951 TaxID=1080233 RepID=A0A6A6CZT6_ZASCE|nr:uncharacterized protein M409DRAFT_17956 [Zasmidium cellare ATCC 36951]KAF2171720.1 hypothetical protein M409DRAFT_17956 [Zasmidium cellare ATCC 36951]